MHSEKKKVGLSAFADDQTPYLQDPTDSRKELLELIKNLATK